MTGYTSALTVHTSDHNGKADKFTLTIDNTSGQGNIGTLTVADADGDAVGTLAIVSNGVSPGYQNGIATLASEVPVIKLTGNAGIVHFSPPSR